MVLNCIRLKNTTAKKEVGISKLMYHSKLVLIPDNKDLRGINREKGLYWNSCTFSPMHCSLQT